MIQAGFRHSLCNTKNIFQLPLSLQLLAGGSDSIRGYQFQSIGPGKKLVIGSVELQQEIKEDWYLNVFFDAGDVYVPTKRSFNKSFET